LGKLAYTNRRFIELFGNKIGRGDEEGNPSSAGNRNRTLPHHKALLAERTDEPPAVCLLPGPVTVAPLVHEAFRQPPIYHRGPEFIALFKKVRRTLGDLVGGRDVALFNGSGTLGNEIVGATLAAREGAGRGLLLVNGEFGERLTRQASRFGLAPRV